MFITLKLKVESVSALSTIIYIFNLIFGDMGFNSFIIGRKLYGNPIFNGENSELENVISLWTV
jgi:hypothetical protein